MPGALEAEDCIARMGEVHLVDPAPSEREAVERAPSAAHRHELQTVGQQLEPSIGQWLAAARKRLRAEVVAVAA